MAALPVDSRRSARPSVLLIDDDLGIRETVTWGLRPAGIDVLTAQTATEGLAVARERTFDLIVVDFRLPDLLGTEVIGMLKKEQTTPLVLFSGFLSIDVAVHAMKLGAADVIQKPIDIDDLQVRVLELTTGHANASQTAKSGGSRTTSNAAGIETSPYSLTKPRSASERWAAHVLRACDSDRDLKTIDDWASFIGLSRSSLCESCRVLGIRPHDARDFARILRFVLKARVDQASLAAFLDISDRRTLRTLLDRAGLHVGTGSRIVSVEDFFKRQKFIASNNEGLVALLALFGMSGSER